MKFFSLAICASAFATTAIAQTIEPTVGGYTFEFCVQEPVQLNPDGKYFDRSTSHPLTPTTCATFCSGYNYFALLQGQNLLSSDLECH